MNQTCCMEIAYPNLVSPEHLSTMHTRGGVRRLRWRRSLGRKSR